MLCEVCETMKSLFTCLLMLFLIILPGCSTNSQTSKTIIPKTYDGWTTVKFNNEVEFQMPPTLEIQSDKYKNRLKEINPRLYELSYPEGHNWIVLQQKGLNDRVKEAFNHYVRVFVYIIDSKEELPAFGKPVGFTKADLKDFEDIIINEQKSERQLNGKPMQFLGVTTAAHIVKINDAEFIHMAFDTRNDNKPVANRELYFCFDKKKIYKISLMIRSTEQDLWARGNNDIRNIVQTFKLIK